MRRFAIGKTILLGLRSLWLHKLRSCLTMLGVIFGVGSVVTMLAVGEGAGKQALDKIRKLGATNIILSTENPKTKSSEHTRMKIFGLKYQDLERIKASCPDLKCIIPVKMFTSEARSYNRTTDIRVIGTSPEWFSILHEKILTGRILAEFDIKNASDVCVISEKLARELLNNRHTLGEQIMLGNKYFTVIGILSSQEQSDQNSYSQPNDIIIPLSSMVARFGESYIENQSGTMVWEKVELHKLVIQVSDTEQVEQTAQIIEAILAKGHTENDYSVSVPLALLKQTMETRKMFNIVLGAIAGISLLVGGIGIMNIMLANVTERVREIGIRRAIGAKKSHIITQFLIETLVLSTLGGLIGILCGIFLPWLITKLTAMPTLVTSFSVILAFSISALIGIVFGLYPAYRAASLDPIKALRHD